MALVVISVCASVCVHSHRSWDLSRGFRETLSTPDFNLEFPCEVLAKWTLYTHTYKLAHHCTAQQTAHWACRHWQLPVVLFPQVPSVTQLPPDRSNHRQGLFRSHPRVKAQRVPKEMTETYKSIALFFSFFFLTPFWMQVWSLITAPGKEVDFTRPGTHQKEKKTTQGWKHSALHQPQRLPQPLRRIARNPIKLWNVSVRTAKTPNTYSSLPSDWALHGHLHSCCSWPMLLRPVSGQLFLLFLDLNIVHQDHTWSFRIFSGQPKCHPIYEALLGWSLTFPH